MQVIDLKLSEIVIDEDLDFRTNGEDVSELAASIESIGLMQPITVAPPNGDGKHHIVAGRRRLRAFLELGRKTIPAIVNDELEAESAQVIAQIVENLQRQDVTAMDEARQFSQLLTYDFKQKDIATLIGCSPGHVSGRLALLKLPENIVKRVESGSMTSAVATKLARLPQAVREQVCKAHTIDERTIASAESEHKRAKRRHDLVKLIEKAGVPAATGEDGWGYMKDETKAEKIGLTDDDKPKTHSWDQVGSLARQHYASDEELADAVAAAKPKGAWVAGHEDYMHVHLIGSANLDLEEKKRQEEQQERLAERQAEERKLAKAIDKAADPIIAEPDQAKFIGTLLQRELTAAFSGFHINASHYERALYALDVEFKGLDAGETDDEYRQRLHTQLFEFAAKNTKSMVRAILAARKPTSYHSVTDTFIDQGFLEAIDVRVFDAYEQYQWVLAGAVDRRRVSKEAEELIAEDEAEQAEAEAFDAKVWAEVDRQIEEAKAEDPDLEIGDDERQIMFDEISLVMDDDGSIEA